MCITSNFKHPFLSTLSLRRATRSNQSIISQADDFYPRSPCGERRVTVLGIQHKVGISIHALLAESDNIWIFSDGFGCLFLSTLSLRRATITTITICIVWIFLSTLSLRRATSSPNTDIIILDISIHALLAESDL